MSVSIARPPSLAPRISPFSFSSVTSRLREFFLAKGFHEVHTQNRLSILAACEDPHTIACYNYLSQIWPLPQTGQMWLEYELLDNPDTPGFFCISTSYRNEPNPVEGRHSVIFPMFEFEMPGGVDAMMEVERELLEFLGFGKKSSFNQIPYMEACLEYDVAELEHEHEEQLCNDHYGPVLLSHFPEHTSPFWNMKRSPDGKTSYKVDVLVGGMETIGSAERSCDPEAMRQSFYTIEDGKYAQKLFNLFGKERVEAELEEFLSLNFFPRSGGGIGVTRLISGMQKARLL